METATSEFAKEFELSLEEFSAGVIFFLPISRLENKMCSKHLFVKKTVQWERKTWHFKILLRRCNSNCEADWWRSSVRYYLRLTAGRVPLLLPPALLEPLEPEKNFVTSSETSGSSGLGLSMFMDCSISWKYRKWLLTLGVILKLKERQKILTNLDFSNTSIDNI